MLEQRGPSMARHDYGYGASVDLFRKDLSIIERFARDVGAKTPLLDDVIALYETAARMGLGGEESAAVHRVYLDDSIESRSSDQDGWVAPGLDRGGRVVLSTPASSRSRSGGVVPRRRLRGSGRTAEQVRSTERR